MRDTHVNLDMRSRLAAAVSLPVLTKELRSRMRGLRTPAILLVATGVTITVACLFLLSSWEQLHNSGDPQVMATVGKGLFAAVISMVGGLCVLIAPALTAGAISLEREQQTLELLQLTQLSDRNIMLGKFLSAMSFITILLLCALPVLAICFLFGGVAPAQLLWAVALILTTSALFGATGLYCSACFKKTSIASAVTYVSCLGWLILPFILFVVLQNSSISSSSGTAYIAAAASLSLLLALLATSFISLFVSLLRRHPASLLFNIIVCSIIAIVLLYISLGMHDVAYRLIGNGPEALLGNPGIALLTLIIPGFPLRTWVDVYFVPITLGMVVLTGWMMLAYAQRQFTRLRTARA